MVEVFRTKENVCCRLQYFLDHCDSSLWGISVGLWGCG